MEYLSYIFSFVSIIFYSIVYFPQFREIYITKKTEGISIFMLLLWTQADFVSLIGTILNNLNLSVILMGWYHSFIGLLMVVFVWFYKYKNDKNILPTVVVMTPDGDIVLRENYINKDHNRVFYGLKPFWYELFYICIFFAINIFTAMFLNLKNIQSVQIGGIFGWISMSLYIIGRFPQIYMNIKRGKTEGLSILMYIFTMCGNLSYIVSLVTYSIDNEYIYLNLPWIISSGTTIILDIFVIYQIYHMSSGQKIVYFK